MKKTLLILFVLLTAAQLHAFQPKAGFVKVELSWASDTVGPIPAAALAARFGGDDVADNGSFHIVYLRPDCACEHAKSSIASTLRAHRSMRDTACRVVVAS
jgi:hypothetical protein